MEEDGRKELVMGGRAAGPSAHTLAGIYRPIASG